MEVLGDTIPNQNQVISLMVLAKALVQQTKHPLLWKV